jgi:hypothetical protein
MQPLNLHAHATGPNPIKLAIALEALSLPYNIQQWDFGDDPQKGVKGETFLRINENGRVPALEDPNTGVVSWESGACMNYLRRVYDKSNLLGPVGDSEQDKVDFEKWEYFLLTTLGPMTGQTNWFRYVVPTTVLSNWSIMLIGIQVTTMQPKTKTPYSGTPSRQSAATKYSRDSSRNPADTVSCLDESRQSTTISSRGCANLSLRACRSTSIRMWLSGCVT